MALSARKIAMEESVEAQIARLEATTKHIQSGVQDLRHDVLGLRQEMKEFRQEMKELRQETLKLIERLDAKLDSKVEQLHTSFESMNLGRVWDRVWMLLAMGALLGVMARGFKWI